MWVSRVSGRHPHDGHRPTRVEGVVVSMTSSQEHPFLPRGLLVLFGLALSVIVVAGMKGAAGIIGPAFLALVLTITVHPLRIWLDRLMPSWAASLVCILAVYFLILGLAVSLVLATARFATLLPEYENEFDDRVDSLLSWLQDMGVSTKQVQDVTSSLDLGQLSGFLSDLLSGALSVVSNLFFILALVLFMTMDGTNFPRHLASATEGHQGVVSALASFGHGTRRYFAVSTAFGLIVAVIDTGALALLGIPVPLLWGLLAFITNYIPNVGFVIGLVPPAILGLLEGGPGLMLAVIAIYSVINVVIQSVIQPKVVGDAVGLSTTLTFLSLVFWAWVIGPLGALLAIPLTLLVKALLVDVDPDNRWLVPILSNRDDPGLSPGSSPPRSR